ELGRERERDAVTRGQQLVLARAAAVPDRPDRVDHVPRREPARAGRLRLSGLAPAEPAALLEDRRAAGTVDRAVDATPAEQRSVRGVDDRGGGLRRDAAVAEPDPFRGGHSASVAGLPMPSCAGAGAPSRRKTLATTPAAAAKSAPTTKATR